MIGMDELDKPSSITWHVAFLVSITAAIIMLLLDLTKEACVVLIFAGTSTFIGILRAGCRPIPLLSQGSNPPRNPSFLPLGRPG